MSGSICWVSPGAGQSSGRKVKRALILCKADEGLTDRQVAEALMVGPATAGRVRQRFVEGGLERALNDLPRPGQRRKLDGKQEAHLVAVACSAPPGRAHPLDLAIACRPGGEVGVDRLRLPGDGQAGAEKNELKPWRKKEWCIPKVSAEFVARMEDVLDPVSSTGQALYAEPYDPKRPVVCFVVCFDETSKQLVSEKRSPIPAKAGRRERFDYEYQRNGTRNLFMTCEPLAGLEARGSDRASHHDRLRPSDALAGGCCLPGSGEGPSGAGQPRIEYGAGSEHS